jgi:hypothetical protein
MEKPIPKPFDTMTIAEIQQELKDVYAELLKDAEEDADVWGFHEHATKALIQLQSNFATLREFGTAKITTTVGDILDRDRDHRAG